MWIRGGGACQLLAQCLALAAVRLALAMAEEGRGARAGFCFCALEAPVVLSQEVALVRWPEHRPTRSLHLASNLV